MKKSILLILIVIGYGILFLSTSCKGTSASDIDGGYDSASTQQLAITLHLKAQLRYLSNGDFELTNFKIIDSSHVRDSYTNKQYPLRLSVKYEGEYIVVKDSWRKRFELLTTLPDSVKTNDTLNFKFQRAGTKIKFIGGTEVDRLVAGGFKDDFGNDAIYDFK